MTLALDTELSSAAAREMLAKMPRAGVPQQMSVAESNAISKVDQKTAQDEYAAGARAVATVMGIKV
jgi:hypothetical protein